MIICGYQCDDTINRCIDSLQMQTHKDFGIITNIDEAENRRYLLFRTVEAIERSALLPDDIIVCLDADDFLCDEMALETIATAYEQNPDLLLTYGSYVNLSTNKTGKFCAPYAPGENFRTSEWRGSHLKTFKHKLFRQVPQTHFQDGDGEYYKCCADRAMMIPMMELAGHDRIAHIPMILYCYNDLNPQSVWNTMREISRQTRQHIAAKPPLARLETL